MHYRIMKLTPMSLFLGAVLSSQKSAALPSFTPGNIIVSNTPSGEQDLFEYTPAGNLVQQIPIPVPGGARDLVIDRDGRVQIYNGTFNPTLTAYNAASNIFTTRSFAGWSTVNNLTYGGLGAFGRFIFVSDMSTANIGAPQGVVRFDLDGGPTVRFAKNSEPIDLYVGLDGLLYTLSQGSAFNGGGNHIDVFNPASMAFIRAVDLPEEHRGIAIDSNGDIYTAQRNNVSRVNHFSSAGVLLDSINDPGIGGFADIDINRNGDLLIASHGGTLLLTTTALDSITSFPTRLSNGTNFAAWIQAPVPEPEGNDLLIAGMAAFVFVSWRSRCYEAVAERTD